jgi:Endonuclease/Exonuclease/phosphatase family
MKSLILFYSLLISGIVQAQVLLTEPFNYPSASRLSANGWTAHSGAGTNAISTNQLSLNYYGSRSLGGFAANMVSSGEDVNRSFGNITTGTVYVSFLVNVKQAQDAGDYFFHLGPSAIDTVFRARVFVKSVAVGKIQFGIAKTRNVTYTTENYDLNKNYLLVVKYIFKPGINDDAVELMVNPEIATEPLATAKATDNENDTRNNIGSIALRQGSSANAATLAIDDIRVGQKWADVTQAFSPNQFIIVNNGGSGSNTDLHRLGQMSAILGTPADLVNNLSISISTINPITVTAPTGFEVADITLSPKLGQSISFVSGNYTTLNIAVRPRTATAGVSSGYLTVSSKDFSTLYVWVSAVVPDAGQKALNIAQTRNLAVNSNVQVTGIVTAQFGSTLYMQDATAGMSVFLGTPYSNYSIGDSVKVGGTLQLFNGQIQIAAANGIPLTMTKLGTAKQLIVPKTPKISELSLFESQLVRIVDVNFTNKNGLLYPDVNWGITTADGVGEIRINRYTNLPVYYKPQAATNVVGVVSRFKNTISDIYQLLPRSNADFSSLGNSYGIGGNDTPRNKSLDLATWNLSWFGSTTNGPTNEGLQLSNIKRVLDSLQADIYVLSEVSNSVAFSNLVSQIPGFSASCSSKLSAGATDQNGQRVCFLYKTDVFKNPKFKNLLVGTNTANLANYPLGGDRFWASGRLPYLMSADVVIDNVTQNINFVGIHARANSTDAENIYRQRRYDIKVLKDTLDAQLGAVPVILAGDFNDDIDETVAAITSTKESSYKELIDDATKYRAITKSLSANGLRSFLTSDNIIDHIVVSDELFLNPIANTEGHETAFRYITDYGSTTSDHLPVFARFKLTPPITSSSKSDLVAIEIFPNPSEAGVLQVKLAHDMILKGLKMYDLSGREQAILSQEVGQNLYRVLPVKILQEGVYILGIQLPEHTIYRKIFVR